MPCSIAPETTTSASFPTTSCSPCRTTMKLDGRVSSYPASARGYSVTNCYLLRQPDAAWLIDTGFGGDEVALRGQIESLIDRKLPLSLLPLRLNEFMSIQNIDPFTLYFNVKECFTGNPDAAFWFDFGAGSDSGKNTLDTLNITTIGREETIPIGALGRPVVVYQAPIRLIATRWIYDEATKTMFTSDMWTHTGATSRKARGSSRTATTIRPTSTKVTLVHAQHPLLVARGRRHREAPEGHRQDSLKARHRGRWRRATAASCAARRPSRSTSSCSTDVLKSLDKSVATLARYDQPRREGDRHDDASSGHARPSQPAAARGRARRLLARRMPGAAPAGQDLSRLQRLVPDRRRDRLDAWSKPAIPGTSRSPKASSTSCSRRPTAAEVPVRHPSGDPALRRASAAC